MKNLVLSLILVFTTSASANSIHQLYFNDSKTMLLEGSELTWFKLPPERVYHEIKLAVSIQNRQLFYPVLTLYDDNKNVRSVIRPPIRIVKVGAYKEGIEVNIPFSHKDTYMSINMPRDLIGQQFNVEKNLSTILPVTTNGSTYYVPSVNSATQVTYRFMDKGFIDITLPKEMTYSPERKQDGGFFELGVNFGGDTIAYNPGGDDYKAGGGALLLIGYDWPNEYVENTSYQVSTGFRYQGAQLGKGENMGWITKLAFDYDFGQYHVGVGLHLDLFSHTKNEFGVKTKIDDSVSPYIFAEWEMTPWVNLTTSYLMAEFTDENGVTYKGSQLGLGLKMTSLDFNPNH